MRARIVKGFGPIFWEMCNRNPIIALNGEVTVWFVFRHMSSIHWARIAKQRFVSSARGFGDLKTKKKFHLSQFPSFGIFTLVHFLFSSFCFPMSSLAFLWFSFSITLDPLHSSLRNFFVGVCRVAESEGRAICFGDLVPADCVLHRLSKELFALAYPVLSTWRVLRDLMASEGSS